MSESQIASRYAQALYEIGEESGQLTALASELKSVAQQISGSKALTVALTNPGVGEDQRFGMLQALAAPLGLSATTINALKLLVRRHRIDALSEIADALVGRADARAGMVRVKVTSARPLTDAFYDRLATQLEQGLKRKVQLEKSIDQSLIAGLVVQVGNNIIDGTVRGRLEKYEHQLLSQH